MAVLTGRDLERRAASVVRLEPAPEGPLVPPAPRGRGPVLVRMFHPDDILTGGITCGIDVELPGGGTERAEIVRGVAEVSPGCAAVLEGRGWVRGNEKENVE